MGLKTWGLVMRISSSEILMNRIVGVPTSPFELVVFSAVWLVREVHAMNLMSCSFESIALSQGGEVGAVRFEKTAYRWLLVLEVASRIRVAAASPFSPFVLVLRFLWVQTSRMCWSRPTQYSRMSAYLTLRCK